MLVRQIHFVGFFATHLALGILWQSGAEADTPNANAEKAIIATSPTAPSSTTNGKIAKAKAERMTSHHSLISLIDYAPRPHL